MVLMWEGSTSRFSCSIAVSTSLSPMRPLSPVSLSINFFLASAASNVDIDRLPPNMLLSPLLLDSIPPLLLDPSL
eukprot:CAMPEP_0173456912 /NCGR_PEP_ID=MMETSP1357-20121228/56805_1 /TAXON_ID=77926 /ORGANISM="Hemiselmis rufescens, Strain PCC563" /LENGTH=74 /DNA_ID=CAMNT_0014424171 /DNA_START=267 /DNA_END=488 /DNA_ORIENTATION=+